MNAANKMSWLQEFLDETAAEGLCVARHRTTCGSGAFSERLLLAVRSASGIDPTSHAWTTETLRYLAGALARLPAISRRDEPAVRSIIMRLYDFLGDAAFEDDFAPSLHAGPAGEVLRSMREHFAARQTAKQDYRVRNDPEAVEVRRAEKRIAGMLRQAQRRAEYAQDFSSVSLAASGEPNKMASSEQRQVGQGSRPTSDFGPTDLETNMLIPGDLIRSYEAAHYLVDFPAGRIVLNIGQPFVGVDGFAGRSRLAIVTACNPFSEVFGEAENVARQAVLVEAVEAAGLEWFPASGVDAHEKWTPEPSLAILDPSDEQLDGWMEAFEQNAVVVAEAGSLTVLRLHPRASR